MLKHFANVAGVAKWFPHRVLSGNHGHCLSQRGYSSSKSDLAVIIKKMKFRRYRCFEKLEEPPSGLEPLRTMYEELDAVHIRKRQPTGGDSSNKVCFGRKTNLFRESGDFARNRDTWEIFREI